MEDLAETSKKALTFTANGHARFLVTRSSYDTQEIADIVREKLSDSLDVPFGEPGKRLADTHYSCDSSKVRKALGVQFRTLEESILPLAKQLYAMPAL